MFHVSRCISRYISFSVSAGAFKLTEIRHAIRCRGKPPLHRRDEGAPQYSKLFSNTPTRCSEFARSKPSRRCHYAVQHD